jgi:hypothetical protein
MREIVIDNKSGFGLLSGLTLLFAAGKIFGFLNWSWWWVFSPIWIPVVVWLGIVILACLVGEVRKSPTRLF